MIVDRWRDKDTYTVGYGTSIQDLKTARPKNKNLTDLPEGMQAKEMAAFTGTVLPERLARRRVTTVPRLLAIYYAFAEQCRGPTFVLTIGHELALAGVVKEYEITVQRELPGLSLQAIWNGLKAGNEELEQHLSLFPEDESEIFDGFQAALQAHLRWDGPIVFTSSAIPGLESVLPTLAKVIQDIDPNFECRSLVLSDWAGTEGIKALAERVREVGRRSDLAVLASDNCFLDAFRGLLVLRTRAAPVKAAVDKVVAAARQRSRDLGKAKSQDIEQQAQFLVTQYHNPGKFFDLVTGLVRAGFSKTEYEDLVRLGGLELVEPAVGFDIPPADVGNYEFRGPQPPAHLEEFAAQGGKLAVAREIEPGVRLTQAGLEKNPVVELEITEPPLWTLVRETEEKLATNAASFADVLGLARKGTVVPEQCLRLLDVLRADKQEELLRAWLAVLSIEEIRPHGLLRTNQLANDVVVENRDKLMGDTGLTVDRVTKTGYRFGEKVLRKASVVAHEKLDDLIRETRQVLSLVASGKSLLDDLEKRSPELRANDATAWRLDLGRKDVQRRVLGLLDALIPQDSQGERTGAQKMAHKRLEELRHNWLVCFRLEDFPVAWKGQFIKPGVKWGKVVLDRPVKQPAPPPTTDYRKTAVVLTLLPTLALLPYSYLATTTLHSAIDVIVPLMGLCALGATMIIPSTWWKMLCWAAAAVLILLAGSAITRALVPLFVITILCGALPRMFAYRRWAVLVPLALCGALLGPATPRAWDYYAQAFRGRNARVVRETVNLRDAPDRYSLIKARLAAKTGVKINDSTPGDDKWYSVRTPSGDGWVHSDAFLPCRRFRKVVVATAATDFATSRTGQSLKPGDSVEVVEETDRYVKFYLGEGRFGLVSKNAFQQQDVPQKKPPPPEPDASPKKPSSPPVEKTVRIESRPNGAIISIDGVPWGNTPTTPVLAAGPHKFDLDLVGYAPVLGETRTVEPGTSQLSFTLVPLVRIRVNSTPDGAMVQIDGKPYGTTPVTADVATGTHTFKLTKDGYEVHVAIETVTETKRYFPYQLRKR